MPIIPDYKPVQGDARPAAPSLGAAMAPGLALASAGGKIFDAGQDMSRVVQHEQEQANQDGRNTARLAYQEAREQHELFRAENPDENTWAADATTRFAKVPESYKNAKLSPHARQQLDEEVKGWGTAFDLSTRADAKNRWRAKARTRGTKLVESYARAGKWDDAEKQLAENESSGLYYTGELDPDRQDLSWGKSKWKEDQAEKAQQNEIAGDPAAWWEAHKDKAPDGMDAMKYQRMRSYAMDRLTERTAEDAGAIEDGIAAGKITTPEDIDHMAADLRPTAREKLKESLARHQSPEFKALSATKQYQDQVVGEVGGMLADWNPTDEKFDEKFVEMAGKIRTLPPGPARDELERQVDAVRSGKKAEIRNHAEAAQKALDDARASGFFGKIPEPSKIPLKKVVDDGFLKDAEKLKRLGFSQQQSTQISSAATDPAAAQKLFKDQWDKRETGSVKASPEEIAIADALVKERPNSPFDDPESEDAVISAKIEQARNYGAAKQKLAEWTKLNPDATSQQIDAFVQEQAGAPAARKLSSGIYETQSSTGPAGAKDSTAAAPVGKDLTEVVKNFEASDGFYRAAYWDVKQWSIGYGTKSHKGEVIDQREADARLAVELANARREVQLEAARVGVQLKPHELDALTSFQYNLGQISNLLAGGSRTKSQIADAMLLYRNADGQRLTGLENRRKAERQLFLRGYGTTATAAPAEPPRNTGDLSQYNVISK